MPFEKGYKPTKESIEKTRKFNSMFPNSGTFKKGHKKIGNCGAPKGTHNPNEFKKGTPEDKHPRWIGDEVGYHGVHDWIYKHKTRKYICELCGSECNERKSQFHNIDGQYKRNVDDYIELCAKCHCKFRNKEYKCKI